ncbi:MAG TPA: hypothetical protein VH682_02495 [Gemmataceae bacterium]|jgi:hypothetical protein
MLRLRVPPVAALVTLLGCGVAALSADKSKPASPAKTEVQEKIIVHEWGTFSTFSGSDGAYRKFYPDDRDLPQFVHSRHRNIKGGLPDVFVSLETPVLYFYADGATTASVRVDFPKGRMTEWYPQASRPPGDSLTWENLTIAPKDGPTFPREKGKSRYYSARETDATPLQIETDKGKIEAEKFLFYRGVGDFQMPLTVRALGHGAFQVKNNGKDALAAFVLVHVQDGKVRFQVHEHLSQGAEIEAQEPREVSTTEKLGTAVTELLIREGLYEKEARAMVKTWSADWFHEDGTRILYLVPARLIDDLLPLHVTPKPSALLRVLVGRHDVLTPERERDIDRLVRKLDGPSKAEAEAADRSLNQLGRYRWPAQEASRVRLKEAKEPRKLSP